MTSDIDGTRLAGRRVAFLFTDGVEQSELLQPLEALRRAGAETVLVSPKHGGVQMMDHDRPGDRITVDSAVDSAEPGEFDALVLPGGVANPDRLRVDEPSVRFVRAFLAEGKPIGAICHGPWLLAEAGFAAGRTMTSWPSLRTDLVNAGAEWVDQEVCVDSGLVTSRGPQDLPAFCAKLVEEVAEGRHRPIAL